MNGQIIIFNVGLNVGNAEPANQLRDTLRALAGIGEVQALRIGRAQWEGTPERNVQAKIALAGALSQSCVAFRAPDTAGPWLLADAQGNISEGGTLAEFPVILADPQPAQRGVNRPGGLDTIGHSAVQPWSAGEYFPAVIMRTERYPAGRSAADSQPATAWALILADISEEYATREDAEEVARWLCQNGRINADRYAQFVADSGPVPVAPAVSAFDPDATLPAGRATPLDVISLAHT